VIRCKVVTAKVSDFSIVMYLSLGSYPLISILTPEPAAIGWWWRTGGAAPLPPEILERSKRNEPPLLLVKFALLICATGFVSWQANLSKRSLGMILPSLEVGSLVSLALLLTLATWLSSMKALIAESPPPDDQPVLLREPAWIILTLLIFGAFAEEFWRAACLSILIQQGVTRNIAILVSSAVFGIGHLQSPQPFSRALGRFLSSAIAGALLGGLFLWFHSLIIPFATHLALNSFGALMGRKRLLSRTAQI
jgi:membrane protease YdiL (CAAX protease family)